VNMKLEIRRSTIGDCRNVYDWRTDPKNSENSWSGGDFKYEDHQEWFADYLKSPESLMLIAEFNGKPCCVMRFDGSLDDRTVSIYMVPGFHGNGFGLECLLFGERWLKEDIRGLTCNLHAEIMQHNIASTKLFTRAGYIYSMADWYKVI